MDIYENLKRSYAAVWQTLDFEPEVAIILGSGLGGFAEGIEEAVTVPYAKIPGFPALYGGYACGTVCFWEARRGTGCRHAGTFSLL